MRASPRSMTESKETTRMRQLLALAAVGVLALGVAACGSSDDNSKGSSSASVPDGGGSLNGAGATFPQPVYDEWGARFKDKTGTTVNYQGIGSGGGVAQFTAGARHVRAGAPGRAHRRRKGRPHEGG